jgi:hypothetical protein
LPTSCCLPRSPSIGSSASTPSRMRSICRRARSAGNWPSAISCAGLPTWPRPSRRLR